MKHICIISNIVNEEEFVKEIIYAAPALYDLKYEFVDYDNIIRFDNKYESEVRDYLTRNNIRFVTEED